MRCQFRTVTPSGHIVELNYGDHGETLFIVAPDAGHDTFRYQVDVTTKNPREALTEIFKGVLMDDSKLAEGIFPYVGEFLAAMFEKDPSFMPFNITMSRKWKDTMVVVFVGRFEWLRSNTIVMTINDKDKLVTLDKHPLFDILG